MGYKCLARKIKKTKITLNDIIGYRKMFVSSSPLTGNFDFSYKINNFINNVNLTVCK